MNNTAQTLTSAPLKKWDELSSDEKIETLRNEIVNMRYSLERIKRIEQVMYNFGEHQHASDGKILIPINNINNINNMGNTGIASPMSFDRLK